MKIQFLGATRQVTGSSYLLEAGDKRILIDRGLFQERKFQSRNWADPVFDPASIDIVLLTHAHLDHCGLLPRLVRGGFRGRIVTTAPSVELAQLVLDDSARIQEEDVAYKKRRHRKEGRKSKHPYVPLYTREDAAAVEDRWVGIGFDEPYQIGPGIQATFREAGHILGAAMIEIEVAQGGTTRRILFSGDIGQWDMPIVGDPTPIERADVVVMESTYGNRDHERPGDIADQLGDAVRDTLARGGNLLVPTFAIERAQELMVYLEEQVCARKIPRVITFLDSPMAIHATEIFERHTDFMDEKMRRIFRDERFARCGDWLRLSRTREQSMEINSIRGTSIILAGSGMCTGGRIKHHLVQNIGRPESTILFVGYQAEGTLGHEIASGKEEVRILGRMFPVRAAVQQIHGLSAHADRRGLMRWLGGYKTPPSKLMLTHGEESAALALAEQVRDELQWDVVVPKYRQSIDL